MGGARPHRSTPARRWWATLAATAFVAAIALTGCGDSDDTTSSTTVSTVPDGITLIDAGTPPLVDFGYAAPDSPVTTRLTMVMDLTLEQSVGGTVVPASPTPQVALDLSLTASAGQNPGTIRSEFVYESFRLVDDTAADPAIADRLATMDGTSGSVIYNAQGEILSFDLEAPADLDEGVADVFQQMEQSIRQMSTPFPDQPIGVGASWTSASRPVDGFGAPEQLVQTYTVIAVDDTRIELAISFGGTITPGQIAEPTLEGRTVSMEVVSATIGGDGRVVIEPASLLPVEGRSTSRAEQSFLVDDGSGEEELDQSLTTDLSVSRRP